MELSELVSALVERNVLIDPVQSDSWDYTTYYVDNLKFDLQYVDLYSSEKEARTVSAIEVYPNHNDGIVVQFLHGEDCDALQLKPFADDESDAFEYEAFELYRLVKEAI